MCRLGWTCITFAFVVMCCTGAALAAGGAGVIGLFTGQSDVIALASRLMTLVALFQLADAAQAVGGGSLPADLHQSLLAHEDPGFRAWGVRSAGNFGRIDDAVRQKVVSLARDPSAEVRRRTLHRSAASARGGRRLVEACHGVL